MTKRRARISAGTMTVAALIGIVLAMRSIASWRPQTMSILPRGSWEASHVSDDGRFLVMTRYLNPYNDQLSTQYRTVDLTTGRKIPWPILKVRKFEMEQHGFTGHFFWRMLGQPILLNSRQPPSYSCRVELYNVEKGQIIQTLRLQKGPFEYVHDLRLKQNGRVLRLLRDTSVEDWNLQNLKRLGFVHLQPGTPVDQNLQPNRISPIAEEILGGNLSKRVVWDARTGKILRSWVNHKTASVGGFSLLSPDTRIVVYSYHDLFAKQFFRFYSSRTGKVLWEAHSENQYNVSFSPDSKTVFTLKSDGCEVRDASSGQLRRQLNGPLAQDVNNARILLGTADWIYTQNRRGEVQRWRVR